MTAFSAYKTLLYLDNNYTTIYFLYYYARIFYYLEIKMCSTLKKMFNEFQDRHVQQCLMIMMNEFRTVVLNHLFDRLYVKYKPAAVINIFTILSHTRSVKRFLPWVWHWTVLWFVIQSIFTIMTVLFWQWLYLDDLHTSITM